MNKELKAAWLTALRSGNYPQGKYQLRDQHNKFCCLGVLCDVVLQQRSDIHWVADEASGFRFEIDGLIGYTSIPFALNAFLGLSDEQSAGLQSRLVQMNDHHNKSFDQIADWIEANL